MSKFHLPETEALSQELFGKAVEELTDPELRALIVAFKAQTTVITAAGDHAEAAIADARRCGCYLQSRRRPDGSTDLFSCRVVRRLNCRRVVR